MFQLSPFHFQEKGFTILEVIVVIGIITVLLAIVAINGTSINAQLAFSRAAGAFEQNVRRAQNLALTSQAYEGQTVYGYGVYVDALNSNKQYILYADVDGDSQYTGSDTIVEAIDFSQTEPGIIILQIDNIVGSEASINFSPPIPTTTITPSPSQNYIDVVFTLETDNQKTKKVSINTAGLIEIK